MGGSIRAAGAAVHVLLAEPGRIRYHGPTASPKTHPSFKPGRAMKRFAPVLAVVLAISAAACTTVPTGPEPAADPSYEGVNFPPAGSGAEESNGSIVTSGG